MTISSCESRARLILIARVLALTAVMTLLAWQFSFMEPTLNPDPDGYVSYARHIQHHWTLTAHRRPPGYPLILALADSLSAASINVDAFHMHLAVIALFIVASMLLIDRLFGLPVAFAYGVLIAGPTNYFVWMGSIMLSDLFTAVFFWIAFFLAAGWLVSERPRRWLWLALFGVVAVLGQAIHVSFDKRLLVCAIAAVIVWPAYDLFRSGPLGKLGNLRNFSRLGVASLILLLVSGMEAKILAPSQTPLYVDFSRASDSPTTFYRVTWAVAQLICLPPAHQSEIDDAIENAKMQVSRRVGYDIARHRPYSSPEISRVFSQYKVPFDAWRERALAHPFKFVACSLDELKIQWHRLLRDLAPLRPLKEKVFHAAGWPVPTDSLRDRLFWSYGINYIYRLHVSAGWTHLIHAVADELWRQVILISLFFIGLGALENRYPSAGLILTLGMFGWLDATSLIVSVDTRYLLHMIPLIYFLQALGIVEVVSWLYKQIRRVPGATRLSRSLDQNVLRWVNSNHPLKTAGMTGHVCTPRVFLAGIPSRWA